MKTRTGILDVPTNLFIEDLAAVINTQEGIKALSNAAFIKTGPNRERQPNRRDWYAVRMASILYRVYKDGPVGTESLRTYYGGKKRRGVKPSHFRKASGKIIRSCLQNLEKLGYIKKAKKGREVSPAGTAFLSKTATALANNLDQRLQQIEVQRQANQKAKLERAQLAKAAGAMKIRPDFAKKGTTDKDKKSGYDKDKGQKSKDKGKEAKK
jgi:small subunit ribosomal protein S19e